MGSRISRLNKLLVLLKTNDLPGANTMAISRAIHLADRTLKLIEVCMNRIDALGHDQLVFRSYSLVKTLFTLHPKHWIQNLKLLFYFNTFPPATHYRHVHLQMVRYLQRLLAALQCYHRITTLLWCYHQKVYRAHHWYNCR